METKFKTRKKQKINHRESHNHDKIGQHRKKPGKNPAYHGGLQMATTRLQISWRPDRSAHIQRVIREQHRIYQLHRSKEWKSEAEQAPEVGQRGSRV